MSSNDWKKFFFLIFVERGETRLLLWSYSFPKIHIWPKMFTFQFLDSVVFISFTLYGGKLYLTLCNPMDCSLPRLLCPWNFQDKNTGVGCHFLLQGIFPIQGSNPCFLCFRHWQADSLPLAPPGKPIKIVFEDFFCFLKKNTDTQTPLETILIFGGWSPETCFIKTPTWF